MASPQTQQYGPFSTKQSGIILDVLLPELGDLTPQDLKGRIRRAAANRNPLPLTGEERERLIQGVLASLGGLPYLEPAAELPDSLLDCFKVLTKLDIDGSAGAVRGGAQKLFQYQFAIGLERLHGSIHGARTRGRDGGAGEKRFAKADSGAIQSLADLHLGRALRLIEQFGSSDVPVARAHDK